MKLSRTNINGNCLLSDIISIALPWLFLELAAPKSQICCSILVDPDHSKFFASAQKTGPRQPAESFRVLFDYGK
jgi:hypothetical protein